MQGYSSKPMYAAAWIRRATHSSTGASSATARSRSVATPSGGVDHDVERARVGPAVDHDDRV
jgi:hypothetical protein